MKRPNLILTLILLLTFSICSYAEPPQGHRDVELRHKEKIFGNVGNSTNRPRKPTKHNEIECFYQDGYLHISFECPEGNAILSISDITDTPCLTQPFSSSIPFTIYIGEIEFPMGINITTDSCIYEGILSL